MFKRTNILFIGLSAFITTCASAGFYIGAGIGPDMVNFYQKALISQPGNFNVIDRTHLNGSGIFGTVFTGYSWIYNHYYLAGELNANISSVKFKSSNNEYIRLNFSNAQYKMPYSFGVSALPGLVFADHTLFYGRLGYSNANFKIATNDVSLANINRNLSGFRYGLGIKQALNDHWAIRLEYSRVYYQKANLNAFDNMTTKITRITPQSTLVEFGVSYGFA